jgi:hypothetical protein
MATRHIRGRRSRSSHSGEAVGARMLSSSAVKPRFRMLARLAKWAVGALLALGIVVIVWGIAGYASPFPVVEITHQKPYADFVGRDYRVVGDVRAIAWNDFPDKARILEISLMPPPTVRNRFVSSETRLKPGQMVRIVSAWRQFALVEFTRHYVVSVPGAELPDGIPVTMTVKSDGAPDSRVYEPIDK